MTRNKLLLLLALLMTAATGAWAQDETYPIVYDFEAAANASEDPGNKNGSGGTGQGFYGWESANYKDRVRQDYKGYDWATGSVLPKVCHVWRRSDRINGNVSNGGLQCPSDKQMAVDGLTEGLTVTIIYDATNASNKEILWAIGDGSSSLLTQPRATATINGVEAVPGETTIKSGDVITVNSVTAAQNGSGYIVFKVMKDMVIKKIIIDEAKAASAEPKHLITATHDEQTRSLEQPLPYATTIGEFYEAVTGKSFSDLISTMSLLDMPLSGISSTKTDVVSIGELNGASTPVTVNADGKATIGLRFGNFVKGIFVNVVSPLYAYVKDGVRDADKWTVKVGEGEAQALPIGGLKGDGTETVTLQYNGRLKVKGVKATSDAAPAEAPAGIVNPAVGQVIGADGKNYADAAAATAAGTTAVAKICYVGSDNGEAAPYNHGLALALSDANGGSTCYWNTSFTDAGHTKQTDYTFTEESGLQYNDTHNSDAYPAFKAAIANNGTAAPTGCSSWFLPSGYQWQKMIGAVGGHTNLGLTLGEYYWSSSENDADHAWDLDSDQGIWCNSNKSFGDQVRACLAF